MRKPYLTNRGILYCKLLYDYDFPIRNKKNHVYKKLELKRVSVLEMRIILVIVAILGLVALLRTVFARIIILFFVSMLEFQTKLTTDVKHGKKF